MAKAFAVRMPEMLLSMAEYISAVLRLTSTFARLMLPRCDSVNHRPSGRITVSTSASRHSIVNITASAPRIVSAQISMFSGPWCASSVTSNRSLVMWLISAPVRFLS